MINFVWDYIHPWRHSLWIYGTLVQASYSCRITRSSELNAIAQVSFTKEHDSIAGVFVENMRLVPPNPFRFLGYKVDIAKDTNINNVRNRSQRVDF